MRDRCEYILYRGLYLTAYARVSRGVVTDTEMQIGQFVVPKHGETTGELSFEDRYLRSYRDYLPLEHVRLRASPYHTHTLAYSRLCSGSPTSITATSTKAGRTSTSIMSLIRYVRLIRDTKVILTHS